MKWWFWGLVPVVLCAQTPVTIAHRGGMALRPENTLSAFENAVKLGVNVLEFDMVITADDRVVIHHDLNINPAICSSGNVTPAPIRSLTLGQIRTFDCGSQKHPRFPQQMAVPGARIPTLEEFLQAVAQRNVDLMGETKMGQDGSPQFVDPARFVNLIYPIIRKFEVQNRFILQSGDYRTLAEMRRKDPRIRTCLLNARRFKPDYVGLARQHGAAYLMLHYDDVASDGVSKLHAAGFRVFSSTANDAAAWTKYLERGMDGILTDDPEALIRFLKNR